MVFKSTSLQSILKTFYDKLNAQKSYQRFGLAGFALLDIQGRLKFFFICTFFFYKTEMSCTNVYSLASLMILSRQHLAMFD